MNEQKLQQRRLALQAKLQSKGLDALLITQAANRFYLSGFELHDPQPQESSGCLIMLAEGSSWLCTDSRFKETAKTLWSEDRIFIYGGESMTALGQHFKCIFPDTTDLRLGFEEQLSYKNYQSLKQQLPQVQLVPASGLVDGLRLIKDADELELMSKSCRLNQQLMQALPDMLHLNLSEAELAWEIEKYFREHGASELAFSSIVGYGKAGAMPHYLPSRDSDLRTNQPVLIDVGARLNDYCSDQTRTLWFGPSATDDFKRTYAAVNEASQRAIAAVQPGIRCCELYAVAYDYFKSLGRESYFNHGLGHGIGLETHESPSLNPRNQMVLQPGMIITIEPGLYYPHWGGVRIEYMVQVTDQGHQVL